MLQVLRKRSPVLLLLVVVPTSSFTPLLSQLGPSSSLDHLLSEGVPDVAASLLDTSSTVHTASAATAAAAGSAGAGLSLFSWYLKTLATHPLPTKMATGALLALTGDAVAQSQVSDDHVYDKKRASSFALFDSSYRALQHILYPIVVAQCHGQHLMLAMVLALSGFAPATMFQVAHEYVDWFFNFSMAAAAMEQTLVSQLIIVPLFYYPVFYAITGIVQGLTLEETKQRAQETFIPLMKRNLLFWIPVQYIQFAFVEEQLQIPFLSVCGLCWTMILSLFAGAARDYNSDDGEAMEMGAAAAVAAEQQAIDGDDELPKLEQEQDKDKEKEEVTHSNPYGPDHPYCITGMEEECFISEDDLFPPASLEDITHELEDVGHDIAHFFDPNHAPGEHGQHHSSENSSNSDSDSSSSSKVEQEEHVGTMK
jgi:hypothetical protein